MNRLRRSRTSVLPAPADDGTATLTSKSNGRRHSRPLSLTQSHSGMNEPTAFTRAGPQRQTAPPCALKSSWTL